MAAAAESAAARRARSADSMLPGRFRVAGKRQETSDTWTLDLEPLDAGAAFEFAPGQFNMIYAFGACESAISVSGNPVDFGLLTHTVRAVGVVTESICAAETGDVLGIRGPYGSAWPVKAAEGGDVIVVAGGIGLAPLRPILYQVLARRDRFRRVLLLYGGRSPDQLLYEEELEQWMRDDGLEVEVTVDTATRDWRGRVGVVPALIERIAIDPDRTVGFVCGPEVMIEFAARALIDRGVDPSNVYISMERNMKCAVGHCGHCQFGPTFVCRDGPVFAYSAIDHFWHIRDV
jgi:NAD(P)H-flavin reductase